MATQSPDPWFPVGTRVRNTHTGEVGTVIQIEEAPGDDIRYLVRLDGTDKHFGLEEGELINADTDM